MNYTDRVELQINGTYCWRCQMDREYFKRKVRLAEKICFVVAFLIAICGSVISLIYGDMLLLFIMLFTALVVFLVSVPIFELTIILNKDPKNVYEMADSYVRAGIGRSSEFFMLDKVRMVVVAENYIELCGKYRKMRVYVPREDMAFVKDYVLRRVPREADLRYG